MTARSYVSEAFTGHLEYLFDGGVPIPVPEKEAHDPDKSEGLAFPSSLGKCPLYAFKERSGAVERFPRSQHSKVAGYHKMLLGNYYENLLVSALIWKYGQENVLTHVSAEGFGARGRVDIILSVEGQDYLLEVKSSAPYGRHKEPAVSLGYVLQALYYRMICGEMPTSIVLFNRWHSKGLPFKVYDIIPEDDGFIVVDEEGIPLNAYWNNSLRLSYAAIKEEILTHQQYLSGNRSDDPMPDFLNRPERWQCGSIPKDHEPKVYTSITKALQYRPNEPAALLPDGRAVVAGTFIPTCPYFCHSDQEELPVTLDEQERLVPAWKVEAF